jgi:chromosome segregation ATPase
MAIVRVSNKLIESIEQKVNRMGRASIDTLEEQLPSPQEHVDAYKESIERQAWALSPQLRGQLPSDWCISRDKFHVQLDMGRDEPLNGGQINLPEKIEVPYTESYGSYWNSTVTIKAENMSNEMLEVANTFVEIYDKINSVRKKYKDLSTKLVDFVKSQPSLNTALKIMPELAMYVAQDYIDRVNEAVEKKPKQKPEDILNELDIDRDELAATAIAHRMSGGL